MKKYIKHAHFFKKKKKGSLLKSVLCLQPDIPLTSNCMSTKMTSKAELNQGNINTSGKDATMYYLIQLGKHMVFCHSQHCWKYKFKNYL